MFEFTCELKHREQGPSSSSRSSSSSSSAK